MRWTAKWGWTKYKTWVVTSAFGNGGWFNIRGRSYVKPETVGQFTGLLDCNGVKIFEGDIAKATCGHVGAVMFSGSSFFVDNYDSGDYYQGQNPDSWDWSKFEIVGNIHQNSELLK